MWDQNIYGSTTDAIGPQQDGTVLNTAYTPLPVDAGGGTAGSYSQQILDVFKFGVGAWGQNKARQDMLDYRRWEATSTGLTQQGMGTPQGQAAQRGTNGLILIGFMVVGALLLARS